MAGRKGQIMFYMDFDNLQVLKCEVISKDERSYADCDLTFYSIRLPFDVVRVRVPSRLLEGSLSEANSRLRVYIEEQLVKVDTRRKALSDILATL
tara:strand:- start:451 stop:735 length:285 start_codon:yes stop_codon:yes gene_type:complete